MGRLDRPIARTYVEIMKARTSIRTSAWLLLALLALCAGCATAPIEPTQTVAEAQLRCERTGGWWRGASLGPFCDYPGKN
jgi:hypothetical protein